MRRLAKAAVTCLAMALGIAVLAGCAKGPTISFDSSVDDAWGRVTFEDLGPDEVSGNITIPGDYVDMVVELEQGTIDVSVSRLDTGALEGEEGASDSDELDLEGEDLYEGVDLSSGTYDFGVPGGGDCLVTIKGEGAKGTITFQEGTPRPV